MDKTKKQIKKMVYNHLNKIYSTSLAISKSYIYELVPTSVLKEVIDRGKLPSDTELPKSFVDNYNKMLDVLYKTCEADATKSGLILPIIIRHHIAVVKTSFISALS